MCVCQRDRLGGASGKGRHKDVFVCVCVSERRHRDVCVRESERKGCVRSLGVGIGLY